MAAALSGFFLWLCAALQSSFYQMVGAAITAEHDLGTVSQFVAEDRSHLIEIGRAYVTESGYRISGLRLFLSSIGFVPGFLLFSLLMLILAAAIYVVVRRYHKSLVKDCDNLSLFFAERSVEERGASVTAANKELKPVWDRTVEFIRTGAHQIEALKKENIFLNEFTQNVYHQIKTSLTRLRIYLEMMEEGMDKTEECQEVLDKLSRQITTLLNIGKLEAQIDGLKKEERDLSILIKDAVYAIGILAEKRGVKIHYHPPEEGTAPCIINYFWLQEAVENLLINACQHSKPGSQIWIRLKYTPPEYHLIVEDQAGGLKRENAFSRYSTSGQDGKYGIGLHECKVIVRLHFGTIRATDNDKGGTTFHIRLPLMKGEAPYLEPCGPEG